MIISEYDPGRKAIVRTVIELQPGDVVSIGRGITAKLSSSGDVLVQSPVGFRGETQTTSHGKEFSIGMDDWNQDGRTTTRRERTIRGPAQPAEKATIQQ